ncbi:hypothetical protein LTR02_012247 [Friedmanniomyces endolithicus]|uniref:RING-type domain-containing protein n=1 Tax=Friedmanniomyces simplex TaxID=329884 RepID=A0A4U0XWR1_9PEZI|nr:hypothetical protein LTR02_012247 [Friedmanniomyces endolithicus]TKA82210.1 hypothetical protein B0A55_07519 [Friedmanniomyces simplex]
MASLPEVVDLVSDDDSDQQHIDAVRNRRSDSLQHGYGVAMPSSANAAKRDIREKIREMDFAYPDSKLIEQRCRHPDLAAFPEPHRFNLVVDEFFNGGLRAQLAQDTQRTEPWLGQSRQDPKRSVTRFVRTLLKAEFPNIPRDHIKITLQTHKHLFPTYISLAKSGRKASTRHIGQGKLRSTHSLGADRISLSAEISMEMQAARQEVQRHEADQQREDERRKQEKQQPSKKETCAICLDEYHWVRQIHCDGDLAHFLCIACANGWMSSMIGSRSSDFVCFVDTCKAPYAMNQRRLLDQDLVTKMAELEQHNSVCKANIPGLEHCPECDYMAVPADGDVDFRCGKCGMISCRSCKSESHYPDTCENHAQNKSPVNHRHAIEEAMTDALLQKCNKCKQRYIKDYGCNEVKCLSCENIQCYHCSQNIDGYDHFDEGPYREATQETANRCPLYDNTERRHEMRRGQAELAARQQILRDHPDTRPEDLDITMSDEVENDTTERIKAAGGVGDEGGDV